MTSAQRDRLATPVVLVYWLMVVGGLVVYGITQIQDSASLSSFAALWAGAVGGTLLGQCLALRDFRLWITVLVIAVIVALGAPVMPGMLAGPMLWQAFIPATLCGFLSLGDRAALVACWFPAVIWMLSILDRSDAARGPDSTGLALLGALAVLFLVFLRVRESRRVGLWRTTGPLPLAPAKPPELLREPPARQLARAGWGLAVTAITVAVTAWIAPTLWQRERLADHQPARSARQGKPCCPLYDLEVERLRVKEYFDLGRGRDAEVIRSRDGTECRICPGAAVTSPGYHWRSAAIDDPVPSIWGVESAWGRTPGAVPEAAIDVASPGAASPGIESPAIASASIESSSGAVAGPVVASPTTANPAPVARGEHNPVAHPAVPAAPPAAPQLWDTPAPRSPPVPTTPPVATPEPPATSGDADDAAIHQPRRAGSMVGPSIVHGLMWLCIAALVFQLVGLALRPLRRLITLRHLRRPFWDETIAQRVSNAWQLALVGLRDAGWRPATGEGPQELARRVGVDGLERCATILERTRHGIGIDTDDLSAMSTSADAAYRAARASLGAGARVIGWLRWPLT